MLAERTFYFFSEHLRKSSPYQRRTFTEILDPESGSASLIQTPVADDGFGFFIRARNPDPARTFRIHIPDQHSYPEYGTAHRRQFSNPRSIWRPALIAVDDSSRTTSSTCVQEDGPRFKRCWTKASLVATQPPDFAHDPSTLYSSLSTILLIDSQLSVKVHSFLLLS
ncbi:hypothetical protein SISSUDRAFT_1066052 [Sistotremastrum suecicum HHB10207 ss-3]|uniref:Uncharacterized protein n=1 Tax=Sistotremastrum suecicum HHB10207 ss-3 TaxID=1314776 RepID=A0A165YST7_9AGAM|nr:hypothetical protein SISSUDRAFT_1066052 [Sistotremastrum suecicum HHB10207 ss-3]